MLNFLRKIIPLHSPIRRMYHFIRGVLAYWLSGNPARDMIVVGVTGTKGKTTTTNIIARGLESAGHKVAMFSTTNMVIDGEESENNLKMTTPSPFFLWNFIRRAKHVGVTYLVIEVSSHALYYHRVYGLHFDVAVLTGIAQDHLDLHSSMDHYVDTKLQLFQKLYKYGIHKGVRKVSVVNIDQPYAERFTSKDLVTDSLYTVGLSPSASIHAEHIQYGADSTEFDVRMPGEFFHLRTHLYGDFNVTNILAAIAVLMSQRVDITHIQKIIAEFGTVPGRLEEIPNNRGAKIFVDYAHTEDSLQNVLTTVRKFQGIERVILVFGATGDRDTSKRPYMGRAADAGADVIILTDDDTYTEDSLAIIRAVKEGINRGEGKNFWIIPNRADAIRTALLMLKKGDVLVVAGKGAETVQVTNAGSIPWNDRKVIENMLREIDTQILLP